MQNGIFEYFWAQLQFKDWPGSNPAIGRIRVCRMFRWVSKLAFLYSELLKNDKGKKESFALCQVTSCWTTSGTRARNPRRRSSAEEPQCLKKRPSTEKNVHRHLFQEKSVAVKKKFRSEVMDGVEACCFDKKRGLRYDWKKSSEINQVGFKERLTDVSEQDRSPWSRGKKYRERLFFITWKFLAASRFVPAAYCLGCEAQWFTFTVLGPSQ